MIERKRLNFCILAAISTLWSLSFVSVNGEVSNHSSGSLEKSFDGSEQSRKFPSKHSKSHRLRGHHDIEVGAQLPAVPVPIPDPVYSITEYDKHNWPYFKYYSVSLSYIVDKLICLVELLWEFVYIFLKIIYRFFDIVQMKKHGWEDDFGEGWRMLE